MKKLGSLSVFFPTLNDARGLPQLIDKTYLVIPKYCKNYEVIIINDGSTDNTKQLVVQLIKKYPYLKVIHHSKNRGYGGALASGFKAAIYEWVFYTDGDGQYDPREISKLIKRVNENTDVVNGAKIARGDSMLRKFIGYVNHTLLNFLYPLPISDIDCDFRLIKRSLLNNITIESRSGVVCLELILKLQKAGARFAEVPVHHFKRQYGRSQFFRPKHLFATLYEHITFYFNWQK